MNWVRMGPSSPPLPGQPPQLIPGQSDIAIFGAGDGGAIITGQSRVLAGLTLEAGYTGTIKMATSLTLIGGIDQLEIPPIDGPPVGWVPPPLGMRSSGLQMSDGRVEQVQSNAYLTIAGNPVNSSSFWSGGEMGSSPLVTSAIRLTNASRVEIRDPKPFLAPLVLPVKVESKFKVESGASLVFARNADVTFTDNSDLIIHRILKVIPSDL